MILHKLRNICLGLIVTSLVFPVYLWAGPPSTVRAARQLDHSWRKNEYPLSYGKLEAALYEPGTNPRVFQEIDALHYTIDAHFFPGTPYPDNSYLEAVVTIDAQAKSVVLDQVVVDFYDNITINSLELNGGAFSNYTRTDDKIWLDLSGDPLLPGEVFDITIDYSHVYGSTYQGLMFRKHGDSDTPAICSIDQPYQSPGWWPCFDYPSDKATADISITCPDWMTAVSNGLLQTGYPADNGDGTKTWLWQETYPIYTSALSVAMTDYTVWWDTYVSPLDSTTMPLVFYAFPEDAAKAMVDFAINKPALEVFAQKFGEYPFITEKYGVAETPNTHGSLEHQTITSLTIRATQSAVNWDVIVHELAHQWWGDWVTCETWNHLWLHEGFATYSEVLFHEDYTGEPAGAFLALEYDDGLYAGNLDGTVYVEDEDLATPFANTYDLYEKGAWVLHMLRHVLGDTNFFIAIKTYGQNQGNATAVTDDLKAVMEAQYGSSLDWFFDQWLYTPYRPIYSISYKNSSRVGGGYQVDIDLNQIQDHWVQDITGASLRDYYIMPLDFTVHYTDETSETFTVTNNQRSQSFQLLTAKKPDYTVFDENINILKVTTAVNLLRDPLLALSLTDVSQDKNNPTTVTLGIGDAIVWQNENDLSHVFANFRVATGCGSWGPDTLLQAPNNRWGGWSWYAVDGLSADVTYEFRIRLQDGEGGPEAIYDGYFVRLTLP